MALAGTLTVMRVPFMFTVAAVSTRLPKFTCVVAVKFVPSSVSVKAGPPTTARTGAIDASVGVRAGALTVKLVALAVVPPGVVTPIVPLVAPAGTVKVMVVPFTTVKPVMATPFNVTAVAPVRLVPVMVTVAPLAAVVGEKLVIVGAGTVTVKVLAAEVPPPGAGLVTVTGKAPA